jgi:hypothetical protein
MQTMYIQIKTTYIAFGLLSFGLYPNDANQTYYLPLQLHSSVCAQTSFTRLR